MKSIKERIIDDWWQYFGQSIRQIKEIVGIEKFDDNKKWIETDDNKLPDDTTLENVTLRWLVGFRKLRSSKKVKILQVVLFSQVASWKNIIFFHGGKEWHFFFLIFNMIFCCAELFACPFNFEFY